MGYQKLTQNSYDMGEVISALQKEIRRGEETGAMYWALELVPQFEAYLWRRLVVIAHEDIGIAEPSIFCTIGMMRDQFFEFRERGRNGTARLILANAIMTMCRAQKSRIADHFQRAMVDEWMKAMNGGEKRPIPDYALDKHTRRGRNAGRRDASFWLEEGCLLKNPGDVDDPYRETAEAHWLAGRDQAPDWGRRSQASRKSSGPPTLFDAIRFNDED